MNWLPTAKPPQVVNKPPVTPTAPSPTFSGLTPQAEVEHALEETRKSVTVLKGVEEVLDLGKDAYANRTKDIADPATRQKAERRQGIFFGVLQTTARAARRYEEAQEGGLDYLHEQNKRGNTAPMHMVNDNVFGINIATDTPGSVKGVVMKAVVKTGGEAGLEKVKDEVRKDPKGSIEKAKEYGGPPVKKLDQWLMGGPIPQDGSGSKPSSVKPP
jgi:hypothetical protein